MAENRLLDFKLRANIYSKYSHTNFPVANAVIDRIQRALNLTLTNGGGPNKGDLQWHKQIRLQNTFVAYDLDNYSMKDVWYEGLNFDAVKCIVLVNLTSDTTLVNKSFNYTFKSERGVVGPGGFRIIAEPRGAGVGVESSSGSAEEGQLVLSTNGDVTLYVILIGASVEQSSSTG